MAEETNVGAAGLSQVDDVEKQEPELKVSEDGNHVVRGDVKYIREEALRNEREKNARLSDALSKIEQVRPEFEAFLQQRAQKNAGDGVRENQQQYSEKLLRQMAFTRGYYKEDNITLDLDRANEELGILAEVARQEAGRAVKPLAEMTTRERAQANRARVSAQQFVDGKPVASERFMQDAFNSIPEEYTQDPQIANLVAVIAAGLESLDDRKNGRNRRREPMFTEGGMARFDGDNGEMSDFALAAARARGKTPEQWRKQSQKAEKVRHFDDIS